MRGTKMKKRGGKKIKRDIIIKRYFKKKRGWKRREGGGKRKDRIEMIERQKKKRGVDKRWIGKMKLKRDRKKRGGKYTENSKIEVIFKRKIW